MPVRVYAKHEDPEDDPWFCEDCSYANHYSRETCLACEERNKLDHPTPKLLDHHHSSVYAEIEGSGSQGGDPWFCEDCSYPNDPSRDTCLACEEKSKLHAVPKSPPVPHLHASCDHTANEKTSQDNSDLVENRKGLAFGQILTKTKITGYESTSAPHSPKTDFDDELGRVIVIYRQSSQDGKWTDKDQAEYLERCNQFRQLYFKIHRREHGNNCSLDEEQIPKQNFHLVFSSNTNVMRSNAKELIALRHVLQKAQAEGVRGKITIVMSQWDGFTSSLQGLAEFLQHFSDLHLNLFVYHDKGEYEEFRASILLQEIHDISDGTKARDAINTAARHALLSMCGAAVNKGLTGSASRANKTIGVSRRRNHTIIADKNENATPFSVKIVEDRAEESADRRRKIAKVDVEVDDLGITCPIHMQCAKLPDLNSLIQHVTDEVANKPKGQRKCSYCDARFDTQKRIRIQVVRHMEKHFNDPVFVCQVLECTKKFRSAGDLQKHTRNSHTDDIELHICDRCDPPKPFKRKTNLEDHIARVHENERDFVLHTT